MLEFRYREARYIPYIRRGRIVKQLHASEAQGLAEPGSRRRLRTPGRCPVAMVAEAEAETAMLVAMPGDEVLKPADVVDAKVVEVEITTVEAEGEIRHNPTN